MMNNTDSDVRSFIDTGNMSMNELQSVKRSLDPAEDQLIMTKNSTPSKMLKCNSESNEKFAYQESVVMGTKDVTNQAEPSKIGYQTCSYYVLRKKRYCKMLVGRGRKFCGQHLTEDSENQSGHRRVPCPLDPKHTCFENKLPSHLKICNARERTDKPFFVKRINEGEIDDNNDGGESLNSSTLFKDLTDQELKEYIKKIEKLFDEHIAPTELRIGDHPALRNALSKPDIGHSVIRHLKQNSSLISLLEDKDLLNSCKERVFVEFGAGRGKLTGWVIETVKKREDPLFVLIDKGSQRYKVDAKFKHEDNLKIKRLKVDIQDLDLGKVEGIEENSEIVACGKHLCGAATDFSLRCITNCQKGRTCGIVIALCCHHRCTWKAYVGKKFLKEIGFTAKDFQVLVSLSSWAVSGSRQSSANKEQLEVLDGEEENPPIPEANINENRYERMGLSTEYREKIGKKVKAIINQGRVEYVNSKHDLQATLVQYVEQSSTLENIALVAYRKTL